MSNSASETGNALEADIASGLSSTSDAVAPMGRERAAGDDRFDDLLSALDAFDAAETLRKYQDQLRALLKDLLGVVDALDDFEHYYAQSRSADTVKTPRESFEVVRRMLLRVLKAQEVVPITAKGHRVNLEQHEVVGVQHVADAADDIVVEEILSGYLWQDRVLRPTKVVVGRAEAETQ
jgi:hypothetical protein